MRTDKNKDFMKVFCSRYFGDKNTYYRIEIPIDQLDKFLHLDSRFDNTNNECVLQSITDFFGAIDGESDFSTLSNENETESVSGYLYISADSVIKLFGGDNRIKAIVSACQKNGARINHNKITLTLSARSNEN